MSLRLEIIQNNDWKFMHGDFPESAASNYNDSAWYDIGIPHSFGIPYFMENSFYVGYGCYRKTLYIESAWANQKIGIEFQGVFQVAEVYINGVLAGVHKGGYTAFMIDITNFVHSGKNIMMVRVNNKWSATIAPRAGEHVFNGGIYRDVKLIVTSPVHIGWYGTYITTPEITDSSAIVRVRTDLINSLDSVQKVTLRTVFQYGGDNLSSVDIEVKINPKSMLNISQETIIEQPALWSPEIPNMYTATSFVIIDGQTADRYETPFGIRYFSFDAEKGFFLNGRHYDIIGANVHQDHTGWSDAVTHSGIRRDVALIKNCGMNFIRGSHYPHHTVFAEECDKQGILFWSELCYWGTGGHQMEGYWFSSGYPIFDWDKEPFEQSCLETLEEMILTNRNHPSIIVWSMSNEPFFCNHAVKEEAMNLIRKLVQRCHEIDPTRPAAVGGCQRGGFDVLGDLAGYNGDGASLFINPGISNFVSEYGSYISKRPGIYNPHYTDNTAESFPWRSGKALWCGFHHGSIFTNMGYMGMIDYARLPLKTWYWYREKFLGILPESDAVQGEPHTIQLTCDNDVIKTDGTEDSHIIVTVYDNQGNRVATANEVLLEVIKGGGFFPTGQKIILSSSNDLFMDGKGAIEMRSYYAGEIIIRATCGKLISEELTIHAIGCDKWSNNNINWHQPPPYITKAPKGHTPVNIALYRPVSLKKGSVLNTASFAVDGLDETAWEPMVENEWITVDLEGTKTINRIEIVLGDTHSDDVHADISPDGEIFRNIFNGKAESIISLPLDELSKNLRYIRLSFTGKGCLVRHIKAIVQ